MTREEYLHWSLEHLGSLGFGSARVYGAARKRVRAVTVAKLGTAKLDLMTEAMIEDAGQLRCWLHTDAGRLQDHLASKQFQRHIAIRWKDAPLSGTFALHDEKGLEVTLKTTPINLRRGMKIVWHGDPNNYFPEVQPTKDALNWLLRELRSCSDRMGLSMVDT